MEANREWFEEFCTQRGIGAVFGIDGYTDSRINEWWIVWQAALSRNGGEAIGEAVPDPNGGVMISWFPHAHVPVGTKLYTNPPAQAGETVAWADLSEEQQHFVDARIAECVGSRDMAHVWFEDWMPVFRELYLTKPALFASPQQAGEDDRVSAGLYDEVIRAHNNKCDEVIALKEQINNMVPRSRLSAMESELAEMQTSLEQFKENAVREFRGMAETHVKICEAVRDENIASSIATGASECAFRIRALAPSYVQGAEPVRADGLPGEPLPKEQQEAFFAAARKASEQIAATVRESDQAAAIARNDPTLYTGSPDGAEKPCEECNGTGFINDHGTIDVCQAPAHDEKPFSERIKMEMPDPTTVDLSDPVFNAIWDVTKTWDVNSPEHYTGYCGMNGSHVMLILNAIRATPPSAPRAVAEGLILPKEPPPGLLMSMAIRYDHALGSPGYYDRINDVLPTGHPPHAQVLESTLRTMRQLYEEVSGHGFYKPEKEAEYAAMLPAAPQDEARG